LSAGFFYGSLKGGA